MTFLFICSRLCENAGSTWNVYNRAWRQLKCVIPKKDDQYFRTSRDNIQLIPVSYGSFITFLAVDGTGYVRIASLEITQDNPEGQAKEPEEKYHYSEHQLMGLKSVTYYGKAK